MIKKINISNLAVFKDFKWDQSFKDFKDKQGEIIEFKDINIMELD
jgi:hypothetical protein